MTEPVTAHINTKVRHKTSGAVHTLLASHGGNYWLQAASGYRFTALDEEFEEWAPTPEVGDVWAARGESGGLYRVLGVDKERGTYTLTPKHQWHDGNPTPTFEGAQARANGKPVNVYVRKYPDSLLDLAERTGQ